MSIMERAIGAYRESKSQREKELEREATEARAESRKRTARLWKEFVARQPEPRDIWEAVEIMSYGVQLNGGIYLERIAGDFFVFHFGRSNDYAIVTDLVTLGREPEIGYE